MTSDLSGRCILIVEDDYLIAQDACEALVACGARVVGPVSDVAQALAALDGSDPIDAAVLDVNLGGEMVFPVADALDDRGVPFMFLTGYDAWALPDRYAARPRLDKPAGLHRLGESVVPLLERVA